MGFIQISELSKSFGEWLQYNYFPALIAACAALAIIVAFVDIRLGPKKVSPAAGGANGAEPGVNLASPLIRIVLLVAIAIGLGLYFWLMMAWDDFTFYDAHIFFQSLAGGPQYAPLQLFPTLGLIRPLSHQEFYPLSLLGNSTQVYQAFAALEVLVAGFFFVRILQVHPAITIATGVAILLTPHIIAAVFHLVDSERNILLLLCFFLWAALRYERSRRTGYVVAASLASFLILQYKETPALVMVAWAGYVLAAARYATGLAADHRRSLVVLAASVMAGCLLWFAVYAIAILPQIERSYLVGREHSPLIILQIAVSHVWSAALVGAILGRLLLARKGVLTSPLWDSVAVAALVSAAVYIKLGFFYNYYYAPAALLSWLYAGRVAELAYANAKDNRKPALFASAFAIAVLAALQVGTSFWGVYAPWKEDVASKADAARFIDGFHASRPREQWRQPLRILFPRNGNSEAAYFIGYLEAKYRDLDLEVGVGALGRDKLPTETSQCLIWIPVDCTFGLPARRGDLVVYFGKSGGDLADLKRQYRLLHVSPAIGFWPNDRQAYVFIVS